MNKPTVSACIPHRDYSRYLKPTLESLAAQTHAISEIVIVDDGSTLEEWEAVKKIYDEWKHDHIKLVIMRLEYNPQEHRSMRIPYVRNVAFKGLTKTYDYIFFPDADDLWAPNYVERSVKMLEEDKSLHFVYPDITYGEINEKDPGKPNVVTTVVVADYNRERLFRQCYVTCCSMMRSESFVAAGMWPEDRYKKEYVFWNIMARTVGPGKAMHGRTFFYMQHPGQRHMEHELDPKIEADNFYLDKIYVKNNFGCA